MQHTAWHGCCCFTHPSLGSLGHCTHNWNVTGIFVHRIVSNAVDLFSQGKPCNSRVILEHSEDKISRLENGGDQKALGHTHMYAHKITTKIRVRDTSHKS